MTEKFLGLSCRMDEVGYIIPTDAQQEALPILFSGHDCILHAQVDFCGWLLFLCAFYPRIWYYPMVENPNQY